MNTLTELKRRFLEHLTKERGRSAKTLENYDRYLSRFFGFARVKGPADITAKRVDEFQHYLGRQPGAKIGNKRTLLKQRTKNYHLIALRSFLKFLNGRGIASLSYRSVKLTHASECPPDIVSSEVVKRLMKVLDRKTLEGKRDRAILELLVSSGLRVSELCALSMGDVHVGRGELLVRGRRGKGRVVPLARTAVSALQKYVSQREDRSDALFIRYGRKQHDGGDPRLHPRAVQRLIKKYTAKAGVVDKVTPQNIRRCFAVDLLRSGADPHNVRALLGHEHANSIKAYVSDADKS